MYKRKWRCVVLCFFVLFGFFCTAHAEQAPIPVGFWKSGGGQYIYCNNPEYIHSWQVSTDENPYSTYMMKCEDLTADRYAVFFCFYNSCTFDVEPDIEFQTDTDATITINSLGFYVPQGTEWWDCLGAWSDLMNINIRTLNGYRQYVPYQPLTEQFPQTMKLSQCNEWISNYIYNYAVIRPNTTFNMLVDFTIESGQADVNFAALKHYGVLKDRSHHNPNAQPGSYFRDSSVKGIDPDTFAMTETTLDVVIDSGVKDGEPVPVEVFNQYYPDGHIMPHWMTNINAAKDTYSFSKTVLAGSDMLSLQYKDDIKLSYYGSDVPEEKKDSTWYFDIYHYDTQEYEEGMPWEEAEHIPNAVTGKTLDRNHPPESKWQFNLGNFGVVTRYHLSVTNHDTRLRYLNYMLDTTQASNLVILRNPDGTMLNPYTLEPENAYALSKGITRTKKEDCMVSIPVQPGERCDYLLDVILPTNCFGGMLHSLVIDNHAYAQPEPNSAFPEYTQTSPIDESIFFNGQENMKWQDGKLYEQDGVSWREIPLPGSAQQIFAARSCDYKLLKTNSGYAARYSGWDEYHPDYIGDGSEKNMLYLFDKDMEYISQTEMIGYISDFNYIDGILYLDCGKRYSARYYSADDGKTIFPVQGEKTLPVTNGALTLVTDDNQAYIRDHTGMDIKINYESVNPHDICRADDLFYYIKSWRTYYDEAVPNIIAVSADGLRWSDIVLPEQFLEFKSAAHIDDKIYIDCKYQTFAYDDALLKRDEIKVQLNGEYLSFATPAETVGGRTMVPMRYFFEMLGAEVEWQGETSSVIVTKDQSKIILQIDSKYAQVDGKQKRLDVPPYIKDDKTMIPLRFLSEALGYEVVWDTDSKTAVITGEM